MKTFLISDFEVAEICYDFTIDHEDDFLDMKSQGQSISPCEFCSMRFDSFRQYALSRGYDISLE